MAGVVGVDTLGLRFPLRHRVPWLKANLGSGLTVGAGQSGGWIEGSVARLAYGQNYPALPFADLGSAVVDLLRVASGVLPVRAGVGAREIEVRRIDVVREFTGVTNPGFLLTALGSVRVLGTASTRGFSERRTGFPTGVTAGPRTSWTAVIYDKHHKDGRAIPPGVVRFEAQLHAARLRATWAANNGGKVLVVADATEVKMENLAKATFEVAGYGTAVMAPEELMLRIAQIPGLSGPVQSRLYQYCLWSAAGVPTAYCEKITRQTEQLARQHGLLVGSGAGPASVRLDWATGREVIT